jgi:hypothetical protein
VSKLSNINFISAKDTEYVIKMRYTFDTLHLSYTIPPHTYEAIKMHLEIPESLASDVDEVYEEAGYTSRTDLIRDATRRRIEELSDL